MKRISDYGTGYLKRIACKTRREAHRVHHQNGINRSAWQLIIFLALLTLLVMPLIGTPVATALAADDPTPPSDTGDQARALVEFRVPDQQAIDELLAIGADLAEYVRQNDDGSLTINAFVTPDELAYYESLGYQAGETIEDESTWEAAKAEREAAIAAEQAAKDAAQYGAPVGPRSMAPMLQGFAPRPEIIIQRVDYFTNYAGRFLSVEANDSLGTNTGGPTLAMSWAEEGGDYGDASTMSKFRDAGEYMYHRLLVRVGAAGSETPVPAMVRVASSTGETAEAPVNTWIGGGLPPLPDGYLKGFLTHYMDPYEGEAKIEALAAEFPDIAEIIPLPYETSGYQRKSMAIMNGTGDIGTAPPRRDTEAQSQVVALFAQAYGQDGGNDVQAEFLDPGAPDEPLTVSVAGSRITVGLATDSSGALASTAAEVVAAINEDAAAGALVEAHTWNNGTGEGIVQPRELVNLSDFLSAPADYPRAPFQVEMLHIGTKPASLRDEEGAKTGVFIYCQMHAREWATPNTCLETAERLVRNYAIDPATKSFVDNLDIFIVPSVNPDGALYSYYDYNMQRKNLTNYCSPMETSGAMPSDRNRWGVDLNRNGSTGSVYDGYDGASSSCRSTTYAGPSAWSEPEYRNLMWVDETYNIKFSMNTHSYGGYFMWPPGAYIADGRVTLPAANIGVNEFFFDAADRILNRVKEERNTALLPTRTGPVCDVLYSAAGNSSDDEWYLYGIYGWDFETGADIFRSTESGTSQSSVGFQPDFATEGNFEALEFASGNYGLLEVALQYANDTEPPVANIVPDGAISQTLITATFEYGDEPSVIYYTLDGSTPTTSSTMWEAQGPRLPGQVFEFDQNTTIKWIAQDASDNISQVRSADFVIDSVPPTLAPTLAAPVLLHGSTTAAPTATDDNSGVASASCDPLDTSSVGEKTVICTATDEAGNTTTASVKYNIVYGFDGFSAPVGSSNTVNAGQAIPLKWLLTDANGAPVTTGVTATVTADNAEEYAAGASGLQNLGDGYYQFNWKTPKSYANSSKTMKLDLGEGAGFEHTAEFSFTK